MRMMATTLLTGPYDWDPTLLPRAEFERRVDAVQREFTAHGATSLLVYGDTLEHGALCYLTGFTPKMGPAFVLVPAQGRALRLVTAGGNEMLVAAKRLTWVSDLVPIRGASDTMTSWLTETHGGSPVALGVWGDADMPREFMGKLYETVRKLGKTVELETALDSVRARKSRCEIGLLRRSSQILAATMDALAVAIKAGATPRVAALEAERAAFAHGAQDVRILLSSKDGGAPCPIDILPECLSDPALAVVSVRFAGYWSEGLATLTSKPSRALNHAEAAIEAVLSIARAGVTGAELRGAANAALKPFAPHGITANAIGNSIGLSHEEPPILSETTGARLEEDHVYSLRVGAAGEGADSAIVSRMVAVSAHGIEVLWPRA